MEFFSLARKLINFEHLFSSFKAIKCHERFSLLLIELRKEKNETLLNFHLRVWYVAPILFITFCHRHWKCYLMFLCNVCVTSIFIMVEKFPWKLPFYALCVSRIYSMRMVENGIAINFNATSYAKVKSGNNISRFFECLVSHWVNFLYKIFPAQFQ